MSRRSDGPAVTADATPEHPLPCLRLRQWWHDLFLVAALLAAAFAVRLYSLQFFHVIATDGTSYALTARGVMNGEWRGLATYGFYPVLIALAGMLVPDLETAGRLVSVVFGSLLVLPLYFLGRALFSRSIAVAACLVAIVWPPFVASSCEVITQATFTTLLLTSIYFIWQGMANPSLARGGLGGMFIGLSFLTRPEALLIALAAPIVLAMANPGEFRQKRLFFWSYGGSFLLVFALNLVLVHQVTGEWQLSAKTDSALNDALSYYLNIPDINYIPGYQPKGYLDIIRDHPAFIWKNSLRNLHKAWDTMLPLPLWLLFFTGLLSGGFARERNRIRLLLLSLLSPLAVIIVFYYIDGGYTEAYLPLMLLFVAAGLATVVTKFGELLRGKLPTGFAGSAAQIPWLPVVAAVYALVLFVPQVRDDVSDAQYNFEMDNGRRAEKHIGLLLKHNLPPGKIMTRWARIAFYAEREWVNVPAEVGYETIIGTAREGGAKYLIVDGMLYGSRPRIGMELFAPIVDRHTPRGLLFVDVKAPRIKGLIPVLVYTNPKSVGVVVYEIPAENS